MYALGFRYLQSNGIFIWKPWKCITLEEKYIVNVFLYHKLIIHHSTFFFHRSHRFSSKRTDLQGFLFYNCVKRFAVQNRDNFDSKCSKLYHYPNNCLFTIVLLTIFLAAYIEILPFKNSNPIPSTVSLIGPHISPKIFYDHRVYYIFYQRRLYMIKDIF